jgi:hypothetical protein
MFEEREISLDENIKSELGEIQQYIPIYQHYIGEEAKERALPSYHRKIHRIVKPTNSDEYNHYLGIGLNNEEIPLFIKFCPLTDPTKILVGKQDSYSVSLPPINDIDNGMKHPFADPNNSAYVDSYFSYITSIMLHEHKFVHGLDCYGSCLAIKKNFRVNIVDDLEYLFESEYFLEHKDDFNISDELYEQFQPSQSCKFKRKLTIDGDGGDGRDIPIFDLGIEEIISNSPRTTAITPMTLKMLEETTSNDDENVVYHCEKKASSSSHSAGGTCSSRSSITTVGEGSSGFETESECELASDDEEFIESCSNSRSSSVSYSEDAPVYGYISEMPANLVYLEGCHETLDDYMLRNEVSRHEWSVILFQIVIALATFQEKLLFIHNDLHTSNVMYIPTDREFLYYKFDDKFYKVPTFGKIWKIIDFGRAIYKFKGKVIFSDSFSEKGDASTQYNCDPYLNPNPNKKIVPPNFSFDLCRLACSLYDYFDEEEEKDLDEVREVIDDWLRDDKDRNILYKKNGEERYEEFKLYKMISRTVHQAIPKDQLERKIFTQYLVPRKNIKKKMHLVMDIDSIPHLTIN